MPIYEFYCPDCHVIFSFLSRSINTSKCPACPRCKRKKLDKQVSLFAATGHASEDGDMDDLPIDESRMERAMEAMASEAESMNEDDPREAAKLMRKFSDMTGMEFGKGMQEALGRMEAGEDPDKVEAEMGDLMESEDPFVLPGKQAGSASAKGKRRGEPKRDKTLYEM
ncbi:MAG: zinc ribbon domain-containing protein [Kiritimatiellae bacterium]|nr:zinc ribbon domain-containing protein [Kiritimatiellia bacterium]